MAAAVQRLNESYFLIDVGTETVVGEQVAQIDTGRGWTEFRFRSFEDFRKKLIKHSVQTAVKVKDEVETPTFKPLADVWLKHPQGKQYTGWFMPPRVAVFTSDQKT